MRAEIRKRAPDGLRVARVQLVEGQETGIIESQMRSQDFVRLARKGFAPRLRFSIGYMGDLKHRTFGDGIGRFSVDLAKGQVLITPRLSFIFGGQGTRYPSPHNLFQSIHSDDAKEWELTTTIGVGISRAIERPHFYFSVGGAVDVGWFTQFNAIHDSKVLFSFSGAATVGVRLNQRAALFIETETGLWLIPHTLARTLAPLPFVTAVTGLRIQL